MKPIIGITCKERDKITDYIKAIKEFGGEPELFASFEEPKAKLELIPEHLEKINGLLLPGGGDMDPGRYSQERHETIKYVSRSRDALEIRLCQKALEANIPIFGICRGIQVMSVAMGGYLYQDIESVYPQETLIHKKIDDEDSRHQIDIDCHSRLSEIVNEHQTVVNSAHHQTVNHIGEGFAVTARTTDNIIEAMEIPSRRFVIGVQYHPERMLQEPELRGHAEKLFKAFISAATSYKNTKTS